MRAIIATDFDGQLRKLIWLTEYENGVSAGICDPEHNPHASYHPDGTFHCKFTKEERVLKFIDEKKLPLNELALEQQLLGTGFAYSDDIMRRLPQFTPDPRLDVLQVLAQSVFSDVGYLAFHIYIMHRSHETAFLTNAYSSYEDKSFMLVTVNLFRLEFFTDHQLGMIIYKRRVTNKTMFARWLTALKRAVEAAYRHITRVVEGWGRIVFTRRG
jgi:hypothetical protein